MPHQDSTPVDYIARTREQYDALGYPAYACVHSAEPAAFTPLQKPLSQSKVGLIASGGIYQTGQIAFHFKDDISVRKIERETPKEQLRTTHFAYDLTASREDPSSVFPLAALRDMESLGLIGALNQHAYTFMGGIYSARKVSQVLAPALTERLLRDEVDVAVLVPV